MKIPTDNGQSSHEAEFVHYFHTVLSVTGKKAVDNWTSGKGKTYFFGPSPRAEGSTALA